MKERPILFSAPMVRALLAGTKTQTRRVAKRLDCLCGHPMTEHAEHQGFTTLGACGKFSLNTSIGKQATPCPYGRPGDRLVVRETWQYADWTDDGYPWIGYQADGAKELIERGISEEWGERLMDIWADLSREENFNIDNRAADRRWRPSIHMPRWASRITLEITGVRVERLQSISEADAKAEGVTKPHKVCEDDPCTHIDAYGDLWEQINGAGSWDANPWVWVVEFKRLEAA